MEKEPRRSGGAPGHPFHLHMQSQYGDLSCFLLTYLGSQGTCARSDVLKIQYSRVVSHALLGDGGGAIQAGQSPQESPTVPGTHVHRTRGSDNVSAITLLQRQEIALAEVVDGTLKIQLAAIIKEPDTKALFFTSLLFFLGVRHESNHLCHFCIPPSCYGCFHLRIFGKRQLPKIIRISIISLISILVNLCQQKIKNDKINFIVFW